MYCEGSPHASWLGPHQRRRLLDQWSSIDKKPIVIPEAECTYLPYYYCPVPVELYGAPAGPYSIIAFNCIAAQHLMGRVCRGSALMAAPLMSASMHTCCLQPPPSHRLEAHPGWLHAGLLAAARRLHPAAALARHGAPAGAAAGRAVAGGMCMHLSTTAALGASMYCSLVEASSPAIPPAHRPTARRPAAGPLGAPEPEAGGQCGGKGGLQQVHPLLRGRGQVHRRHHPEPGGGHPEEAGGLRAAQTLCGRRASQEHEAWRCALESVLHAC